jgi:hypothetical protein
MDFRGKLLRPKLIYIDGEFHENLVLKIGQNGKIDEILTIENIPQNSNLIELKNEVSLFENFSINKIFLLAV